VGAQAFVVALLLAPVCAWADPDPLDPSRLPPPVLYNYGENETPRSAAMGGALRALGNGTTAPLFNPAGMVATRVYHIEALAQVAPESGRRVFGGTVTDSVTGRLAGAVSFMGGFLDDDGLDRSFIDARLALALPISDRVFIGVGGRYLKAAQLGHNAPFGEGDPVAGGLVDPEDTATRFSFVNSLTFDVGLTIKPTDSLYIAAVGQNLTYPNNGLLPTLVGGGLGYGTADLSLEVDGLADLNSWGKATARIMAGGEILIASRVPIRAGYRYDQGAGLHTLSAGVGYVSSEFSLEASVSRSLSDPGVTGLFFSAAYFLESTGLTRTPTPAAGFE